MIADALEICAPSRCAACGRLLIGRRAGTLTCSGRCRISLWRISVTRGKFKGMSHEAATLTRPEVAELLGCDPLSVRRLECDNAARFPKPRQVEPNVWRWSRGEVLGWAARRGRTHEPPIGGPLNLQTRPLGAIETR